MLDRTLISQTRVHPYTSSLIQFLPVSHPSSVFFCPASAFPFFLGGPIKPHQPSTLVEVNENTPDPSGFSDSRMTSHNASKSSLVTIPPLACACPLAKSSPMRSVSPGTRAAYSLNMSGMLIPPCSSPATAFRFPCVVAFVEDGAAPRLVDGGSAQRAMRHAKFVIPAPARYPLFAQITICKRGPFRLDAQRVAISYHSRIPTCEYTTPLMWQADSPDVPAPRSVCAPARPARRPKTSAPYAHTVPSPHGSRAARRAAAECRHPSIPLQRSAQGRERGGPSRQCVRQISPSGALHTDGISSLPFSQVEKTGGNTYAR